MGPQVRRLDARGEPESERAALDHLRLPPGGGSLDAEPPLDEAMRSAASGRSSSSISRDEPSTCARPSDSSGAWWYSTAVSMRAPWTEAGRDPDHREHRPGVRGQARGRREADAASAPGRGGGGGDRRRDAEGLEEAFRFLWEVRLRHHAERFRTGREPDDFVDPERARQRGAAGPEGGLPDHRAERRRASRSTPACGCVSVGRVPRRSFGRTFDRAAPSRSRGSRRRRGPSRR